MAISSYAGANVSITVGTFESLIEQHNEIAFDMSQRVLTAANVSIANSSNESQITGNSHYLGS